MNRHALWLFVFLCLMRCRQEYPWDRPLKLHKDLEDPDPKVRVAAASEIASIYFDMRDAVPALIDNLDHSDVDVRASAIRALRNMGLVARSAIPKLAEIAKASTDSEAHSAAITLAYLGPEAEPFVVEAMQSKDFDLRIGVIMAVGEARLVTAARLRLLEGATKDRVPEVQKRAGIALEQLREESALVFEPASKAEGEAASTPKADSPYDQGGGRAEAVLAKAISDEMDQLRSDKPGNFRYALLASPFTLTAYMSAEVRNTHIERELAARQSEIHGLLAKGTPSTVKELDAHGDLTSVLKNLIQPPTEKNGNALKKVLRKFKNDPKTAAIFVQHVTAAAAQVGGQQSLWQAAAEGAPLTGGAKASGKELSVSWNPKPLLDALQNGDQQELAAFLTRFYTQVEHAGRDQDGWNWTEEQKALYNQELDSWSKKNGRKALEQIRSESTKALDPALKAESEAASTPKADPQ